MSVVLSARGRLAVQQGVGNAVRRIVRAGTETPAELADRLGVSKETINRWVSGLGWPNYIAASRIAALVGVDASTGRISR